jgi:hypothetical protein
MLRASHSGRVSGLGPLRYGGMIYRAHSLGRSEAGATKWDAGPAPRTGATRIRGVVVRPCPTAGSVDGETGRMGGR